MRRSKLDTYLDILAVLASGKPLKITHIMQKANLNCNKLKENLEYLITMEMAEKRTTIEYHTAYAFYAITAKGLSTLKYFRDLKPLLPITENIESFPTLRIISGQLKK
jgi:predicted transcriptional regulator